MDTPTQSPVILNVPGIFRAGLIIIAASLALPLFAADEYDTTITGNDTDTVQSSLQANTAGVGKQASQTGMMEEVTVIGQQIILDLREQIIEAEDRAFDIFNELNNDDLFDVHCRKVARTGTLIRKRACLPNFYGRATAENGQEFLGLVGGFSNFSRPTQSSKYVFAKKFPIFKNKVKELARENPELMSALQDLMELSEDLRQKRAAYHGEN